MTTNMITPFGSLHPHLLLLLLLLEAKTTERTIFVRAHSRLLLLQGARFIHGMRITARPHLQKCASAQRVLTCSSRQAGRRVIGAATERCSRLSWTNLTRCVHT